MHWLIDHYHQSEFHICFLLSPIRGLFCSQINSHNHRRISRIQKESPNINLDHISGVLFQSKFTLSFEHKPADVVEDPSSILSLYLHDSRIPQGSLSRQSLVCSSLLKSSLFSRSHPSFAAELGLSLTIRCSQKLEFYER